MATDQAAAMAEAIEAGEDGSVGGLLERLADRIGGHAHVKAVFGEPIQQGDVTVVPVARVRWGIGRLADHGQCRGGAGAGLAGLWRERRPRLAGHHGRRSLAAGAVS